MSEYTAIRAISESLRALLEQYITEPGVEAVVLSPQEMREDNRSGVSVWLYRVTRNEHLLNQPPQRLSATEFARNPLPVNLHYLLTPIMTDILDEQTLLGRILQVFNDHPVLRGSHLQNDLAGSGDSFRVHLETLTLEELTRVWGALQEPYQTSLSYLVQVVSIDSEEPPRTATPLTVSETTTSQILDSVP